MKCPLFMAVATQMAGHVDLLQLDCLKADCAWWDIDLEECGFYVGFKALDRIDRILTDIKDKMPHAGQFTKEGR